MPLGHDALDLAVIREHLQVEVGGDTREVSNMLFYLAFPMDVGAYFG